MKSYLLSLALLFALPRTLSATLRVVATTPDLGAIAEEVGGKNVEVSSLAKPTEDPHFVDAKPSFILRLNQADVLVEGGAELEIGWLPALLQSSRNRRITIGEPGRVQCHEQIQLLEVPTTLDRSRGDVHAVGNPHYLTDPVNALIGELLVVPPSEVVRTIVLYVAVGIVHFVFRQKFLAISENHEAARMSHSNPEETE